MKKQLTYFIICFIATIFALLMIFYIIGGVVNQNLLEQLFNDPITMVALVIGVVVLSIIAAKIDSE